jgi:hypothetical protein
MLPLHILYQSHIKSINQVQRVYPLIYLVWYLKIRLNKLCSTIFWSRLFSCNQINVNY